MNSAHDLTEVQINNLIALGTAPKVEEHQIEALIVKEDFHQFEGTTLITCVLTLKNGYTVSGESACADPTNFKEETGKALARKEAKSKIWALEGYVLKNKLAKLEAIAAPGGRMADFDQGYKTYVGTKVVHAVPMTRGQYNTLQGWILPLGQDPEDQGYLIQYADGGAPNHKDFTGYISWSPKDVFEKAYATGVSLKSTSHVERMVTELAELTDKAEKLSIFAETSRFMMLPLIEQQDLHEQLHAMTIYQNVLCRRLERAQDKS